MDFVACVFFRRYSAIGDRSGAALQHVSACCYRVQQCCNTFQRNDFSRKISQLRYRYEVINIKLIKILVGDSLLLGTDEYRRSSNRDGIRVHSCMVASLRDKMKHRPLYAIARFNYWKYAEPYVPRCRLQVRYCRLIVCQYTAWMACAVEILTSRRVKVLQ